MVVWKLDIPGQMSNKEGNERKMRMQDFAFPDFKRKRIMSVRSVRFFENERNLPAAQWMRGGFMEEIMKFCISES